MWKLPRAIELTCKLLVSGPSGADAPAIKMKLIDILPAQVLP
jgi:hypothetical protein